MPYKVNKVTLRRLILVRHDYNPSVRRLFREIGMESKYKGTDVFSDIVAHNIANHLGVDVSVFAEQTGTRGRPKFERTNRCPARVPLDQELRTLVCKAATRAKMKPGAWVLRILRESAEVTLATPGGAE